MPERQGRLVKEEREQGAMVKGIQVGPQLIKQRHEQRHAQEVAAEETEKIKKAQQKQPSCKLEPVKIQSLIKRQHKNWKGCK